MRWNPGYSVIGLIILILEIIVIIEILKSGKPTIEKLLWILLVLMFPLVGIIIYYFFGRGGSIKV